MLLFFLLALKFSSCSGLRFKLLFVIKLTTSLLLFMTKYRSFLSFFLLFLLALTLLLVFLVLLRGLGQ